MDGGWLYPCVGSLLLFARLGVMGAWEIGMDIQMDLIGCKSAFLALVVAFSLLFLFFALFFLVFAF